MLKPLVHAAQNFLHAAGKDSAPDFQIGSDGNLIQKGVSFPKERIVHLQRGPNAKMPMDTSLDQLVGPCIYLRLVRTAEDEESSRAQQSYSCWVVPLHASAYQLKLPLGGHNDLRLKATSPASLTEQDIKDKRPLRLAWVDHVKQVLTLRAYRLNGHASFVVL